MYLLRNEDFRDRQGPTPIFPELSCTPSLFSASIGDTCCNGLLVNGSWPCHTAAALSSVRRFCLSGLGVASRALYELGCEQSLLGATFVLAALVLATSLCAVHHKQKRCACDKVHAAEWTLRSVRFSGGSTTPRSEYHVTTFGVGYLCLNRA